MKASDLRHQSNHNIPSFQNVRAPLRGVTGTASFQGRTVKSEVLQSGLQSNNFLISAMLSVPSRRLRQLPVRER